MSLSLTPYAVFDGRAAEAIQFYEQALGAKLLFKQSFGEMPQHPDFPLPPDAKERVGHAMLTVGESNLMISDTFPGQPLPTGSQVSICITSRDKESSQRLFDALKQGGQVVMPLQETHFSPAYAVITDKFGVTFHIFTEGLSQA